MAFGWNIVYCGVEHCYCLLLETIVIICSLEPLLYFNSLGILFLMGLANILYTNYCLLLLKKKKKNFNVTCIVICYYKQFTQWWKDFFLEKKKFILQLNYDLLKLGKSFKKALFVYLTRYMFFTVQLNVQFQSRF